MASVLVTGCSSGVGLATALAFGRRGDRTFAGVRRPQAAEELRAAIHAESLPVEVVALDVCDQASVDAALGQVHDQVGALDVLVNNAGISPFARGRGPAGGRGPAHPGDQPDRPAAHDPGGDPGHAGPPGRGVIVNVSSVSGFISIPFLGIYSASKFGLEAMSEALAHEVEGAGIRVAVVRLGVFDTAIGDKSPAPPPSAALGTRAAGRRPDAPGHGRGRPAHQPGRRGHRGRRHRSRRPPPRARWARTPP